MSRTGAFLGLLALLALSGAAWYATTRAGAVQDGPVRSLAPSVGRVRVEVLNAGGIAGQARAATVELRERGFDVVHFGNAQSFDRRASSVVDRVGRPELARLVADALAVQDVSSDPDPNLFVDVTVLLGSEWAVGQALLDGEATSRTREPWDPRGWIGR